MTNSKFLTGIKPSWCPGCTNFAILIALEKAFSDLKLRPEEIVIAYDIGCGGNMGNFLRTSAFFGLHGRAVPLACGIKLGNPKLTVLAIGGDGGQLGEGTNHLIHAARRNDDITLLILNNLVFSLTTGQASPTTPLGMKTKTTLEGNQILPVDAVSIALSAGASFIARVFAGDIKFMVEVLKKAITHQGFSLVEILSCCLTFSQDFNFAWFKKRIIPIKKPFSKKKEAFQGSKQTKKKIPVGIFFREKRIIFNKIAFQKHYKRTNFQTLLRNFE